MKSFYNGKLLIYEYYTKKTDFLFSTETIKYNCMWSDETFEMYLVCMSAVWFDYNATNKTQQIYKFTNKKLVYQQQFFV